MDKKNTTIGVMLLIAAFAALYLGGRLSPSAPPPAPQIGTPSAPATGAPGQPGSTQPPLAGTPSSGAPAFSGAGTNPTQATFATIAQADTNATITTLGNEFIELRLTNYGGAIRDVALKKYPSLLTRPEPYVFNAVHADPILAFAEESFPGLGRTARFEQASASATEVVYRAVFENRIEVTRRYAVNPPGSNVPGDKGDPYRVRHETTFRNLTAESMPLPRAALSLGTASLVNENDYGQYLNIVSFDGNDVTFTDRGALEGGGFLSWFGGDGAPKAVVETPGAIIWASAKNQFFASIFTLDKPGTGVIARRIELPSLSGKPVPDIGMTGAVRMELPTLPANGSTSFGGSLYIGPKEYTRLAKFEHKEDYVMQYSRLFFNRIFLSGYIAPLMNYLMNFTHSIVGNWGAAIVLMTLILKLVTLPLTLAASKSAKRMQKLQPEMVALKEKYKDNPQKMQVETMALFKKYGVNPVGGCLPVLATFPLFIGFFAMLQGTAELRYAPFLWVHDLSAPDTVLRLALGSFSLPLNIMPLLMGATMVFQMRLTPQPAVDNAQAKMFKFMPIIFTLFCYNFAAALALYSTINGLFTIGQQLLVNRMKDEPLPTPVTKPGKSVKNVTPAKGLKK